MLMNSVSVVKADVSIINFIEACHLVPSPSSLMLVLGIHGLPMCSCSL